VLLGGCVSEPGFKGAKARVSARVRELGLLPFTDANAPSVVSLVAGSPIAGSWWGHPAGGLIYEVGEALEADSGFLIIKLWRGKRTLVDRSLWPALVRVGKSHERWQTHDLEGVASELLGLVEEAGSVRSDGLPGGGSIGIRGRSDPFRALERRLLVIGRSVHTPSGAHALEAESWSSWSRRRRVPGFRGSVAEARLEIEEASRRLAPAVDPLRLLPWGIRTKEEPRGRGG
jgi:hypothetical protein